MKRTKKRTDYVLSKIRSKFPEVNEVDVSITETSDHSFKTSINLKRFGHHFAAVKRARGLGISLRLALKALERQIDRVKHRRRKSFEASPLN